MDNAFSGYHWSRLKLRTILCLKTRDEARSSDGPKDQAEQEDDGGHDRCSHVVLSFDGDASANPSVACQVGACPSCRESY